MEPYVVGFIIIMLFVIEVVFQPRPDFSDDFKLFIWYNKGRKEKKHRTHIRIF